MKTPRLRLRGLTLMEVTLSVAVLAMMATLVWGSIARTFDAYETVTDIDRRYHGVRVAMNRMSKELSMAFLTSVRRNRDSQGELRQKTRFYAKPGSPFHEIHFSAFAHEILRADVKESDQAELAYMGERDPEDARKYNLVRREDPRLDEEPEEGGRIDVLAEGVKDFKLRFWDPRREDWTDEWDNESSDHAGRLPTVVEIKLVIEDENGEDLTFITKTRINLSVELGTI